MLDDKMKIFQQNETAKVNKKKMQNLALKC